MPPYETSAEALAPRTSLMDLPDNTQVRQYRTMIVILCVTPPIFFLRFVSRYLHRMRFGWDDFTLVVGFVCWTLTFVQGPIMMYLVWRWSQQILAYGASSMALLSLHYGLGVHAWDLSKEQVAMVTKVRPFQAHQSGSWASSFTDIHECSCFISSKWSIPLAWLSLKSPFYWCIIACSPSSRWELEFTYWLAWYWLGTFLQHWSLHYNAILRRSCGMTQYPASVLIPWMYWLDLESQTLWPTSSFSLFQWSRYGTCMSRFQGNCSLYSHFWLGFCESIFFVCIPCWRQLYLPF